MARRLQWIALNESEVVEWLRAKALVAEPAAVAELAGRGDCGDLLERVEKRLSAAPGGGFVATKKMLDEVVAEKEVEQRAAAAVVVVEATGFKPAARDVASRLRFRDEWSASTRSGCGGGVNDFVGYFRDRFKRIAPILRARASEAGVTPISKLKSVVQGRGARIVGIVADKRETKNGHLIFELEDEEGIAVCLVSKDSPLMQTGRQIVLDEVIAVDGVVSNSLFVAKNIVWPEVPIREKRLADEDVAAAFISDLHVGSRFFLQDQFQKFLRFLKGEGSESEKEVAGKIKYLFVAGDVVDGIGVYPSQEKELVTKDIYMQYEIFAELMKIIPEYIEVIVIPGNHDAVRVAEPQPPLLPEFTKSLSGYSNIHFAGNPAVAEAHGLSVLMYHGSSLFSMIENNPALAGGFQNPEKVGIDLLRRRHLSPIYGGNPVVPECRDYLVIPDIPDIFHFGHVHKNGYADYRGTMVINSGTWQDVTEYQVKQGHVPSPCQLPVYNLRTGGLNVLSFKEAPA
ncbi:MAG: DNA-directed DNA polymerase II small subunit [Candidatus Micrarchaeota archaeon]|nr:DNA-directed DNA polymerase II small subunit [Candidatus Micrarchaeota archaeon]